MATIQNRSRITVTVKNRPVSVDQQPAPGDDEVDEATLHFLQLCESSDPHATATTLQ
ncbi:MAG: hypothetical protein I8H71_11205 [Xanthomonadaceae bacterium]|jgi:hypothetical protein|nr:hypothetical protein [Xanthomonadaceae bacterium]